MKNDHLVIPYLTFHSRFHNPTPSYFPKIVQRDIHLYFLIGVSMVLINFTRSNPLKTDMRSLNELFEYIENSDIESLNKELDEMGLFLIKKYGTSSDLYYKGNITKLNTLVEQIGHHFRTRFPNLFKMEVELPPNDDYLLTVEEVSQILKTSKQTIYTMIKKGKIKTINFGSVDGPKVKGNIRISRTELKNIGK
jgi:excisionase family DNA binding protein